MMRVDGTISMIKSSILSGEWSDMGNVHMNLTWEDCGVWDEDEITETDEGIAL